MRTATRGHLRDLEAKAEPFEKSKRFTSQKIMASVSNSISRFDARVLKRPRLAAILLGFLVPAAIAIVELRWLWSPPGLVFYGDQVPILNWNSELHAQLFVWYQGSLSTGYNTITDSLLSVALYNLLGTNLSTKVVIVAVAFLPGTTLFFALTLWDAYIHPIGSKDRPGWLFRHVLFLCSAIMYMLLFTNTGFVAPFTPGISYVEIFTPLLWVGTVAFLKTGRPEFLVLACASAAMMTAFPMWVFFWIVLSVPPSVAVLFSQAPRKSALRVGAITLGISGITAFVWLPIVIGFFHPSGGIYTDYTGVGSTVVRQAVEGSSWYNLTQAFILGQPPVSQFHTFPANYTLLNILFPTLAFSALLVRRSYIVASVAISALLSILLLAGTQGPVPSLYATVAAASGPFGLIFRNVNLWTIPLSIAYGFLISELLCGLRIPHLRYEERSFISPDGIRVSIHSLAVIRPRPASTPSSKALSLIAALLLISVSAYGLQDIMQPVEPYYTPHEIPPNYQALATWLGKNETRGTIFYPNGGEFNWRKLPNDGQTDFPATITSTQAVDPNLALPYLMETHAFGGIMSDVGATYFVLHNDTTTPTASVYQALMNQSDMRIAWQAPNITVFESLQPQAPVYSVRSLVVNGGDLGFLPQAEYPEAFGNSSAYLFATGGPRASISGQDPLAMFLPASSDTLLTLSNHAGSIIWEEDSNQSISNMSAVLAPIMQSKQTLIFVSLLGMSLSQPPLTSLSSGALNPAPLEQVDVGSPNLGWAPVEHVSAFNLSGYKKVNNSAYEVTMNVSIPPDVCSSSNGQLMPGVTPTILALQPGTGAISSRLGFASVNSNFEWSYLSDCKATVKFTLPVDQSYAGVVQLACYYTGTQNYSTLSPVFFGGSFLTTGTWATQNPILPIQKALISESNMSIDFYVPKTDNYTLSINPTEVMDSSPSIFLVDENQTCVVSTIADCRLQKGWTNASVEVKGAVLVDSLLLASSSGSLQGSLSPFSILAVDRVSPVQWEISVAGHGIGLLAFPEQFNSAWVAEDGSLRFASLPLDGIENGFLLSVNGSISVTLSESDQVYLQIGALMSGATGAIICAVAIVERRRKVRVRNLNLERSR